MHLLIMLCLFTRDSFAKFINENCFCLKFLFVLGVTIGLFFVHNDYLLFVVEAAGYISILFLVYQSIGLIDFGYSWNEVWVEKFSEGTTFYGVLLLGTSILLFILNCYSLITNFITFWIDNCTYNKVNLIVNAVIIVLLITLVLVKYNESSSVMTAFFISVIFTYYNGISLASISNDKCNPFVASEADKSILYDSVAHIFINLALGFLSMTYSSLTDGVSKNLREARLHYNYNNQEESINSRSLNETFDEENIRNKIRGEFSSSRIIYKSNEYIVFHGLMALFSLYLIVIFFDWRQLNLDFDSWTQLIATNLSGFFVKTIVSIILLVLYIWTLIAPAVCPNRSFD